MCGISGFIGKGNKNNLLDMMKSLHHRGPDDEGMFVEGVLHLGHNRLSIIDLSKNGRQPMSNEDSTIWVACNGEIYNYKSLKKYLTTRGHIFKSNTDSEVIIHLFEEFGVGMFKKLQGMFAFSLWDKNTRKLYLVRDKMGQKPIYYAFEGNTFIFASETRSILKHPLFYKKINKKSIAKFLFYEHVPTPDTIWEGIKQLNQASYLVYDPAKEEYKINKYWQINFLPRIYMKEEEYINILEEKLIMAIKRHLAADVPVGLYLSGGMDSTTLAYYSQKILNGTLKTFTIAFKEATFDEQYKARETAKQLKTDHCEIDFFSKDFLSTTLDIIPRSDAPFADSSLIPAYYINRFAKNHIKVALGGEGGDEIFVGYPYFRAHELLKYLSAIPEKIRKKMLVPLINTLPSSYKNETWEYKLKKFVEAEGFLENPYYCQQIWIGAFGPDRLLKLFKKEHHEEIEIHNLFENIDIYRLEAKDGEETIDGLLRQTQHKYLMDDGLTKTDRASMANSLEMRAPFLDDELVEWVNRVPFKVKYYKGNTKLLLKKLMKNKIPDNVIYGYKRGFTPPIAEWFISHFQKRVKEYIFLEDDLFNKAYIERLWNEHISQKQNHRKLLWTLFVWKLWSAEK